MYIIKISGPKMLPCGTPVTTGMASDTEPLMQAIWAMFSRYEKNHFKDNNDRNYILFFFFKMNFVIYRIECFC